MSCRVAIIGGGPGGLMTAYRLQQKCTEPVDVTIYEASPRLGGKVLTRRFESADVAYEAGAAELYDYSLVGEDPLRELVVQMGLSVKPMSGASIIVGENVLGDMDDVGRVLGPAARRALAEFDDRAHRWSSPEDYYESDWRESNADSKTHLTFEDELAGVPDASARQFLRTMVHSDLATEPHLTSAAYGLQNYLMNDPAYMRLYTIEGGIEQLPQRIARQVEARVLLQETVLRVEPVAGQRLRVFSRQASDPEMGVVETDDYDFVVVALPNNYLPSIEWGGDSLSAAMRRHHLHYDYPAHYLRVSVLFREPFWRGVLQESYFMLDAFGGCCLYDESARNRPGKHGALGWLLAGEAAMTACNHSDEALIRMVLDALPEFLQHGRELFVEGKVHRWIGAVNGRPGGETALDMDARHIPDASQPNLMVVGDYLFDSTLNGVLDSADFVAELLTEEVQVRSERAGPLSVAV